MKTALRIISSLVIALVFALVLHQFSFRQLPKKIVRVTGSRESRASEVRKDFFLDGIQDKEIFVLEVVLFEAGRDAPALNFSLNGTPAGSFAANRKTKIIDFPASFLRNGKNSLAITADRAWSFKTLRLKNIYGYSSGFPNLAVLPKQNEFRAPGSPQEAKFYFLFLFLFFSSAFALGIGRAEQKAPPRQKLLAVRRLRFIVPALSLLVLLMPLGTKYRIVLGFRSILYLAAVYFGLLYLEEIKNFLSRAIKELPRFFVSWQEPITAFALTRAGIYGLGYLSSLAVNKGAWFSTALPTHFLRMFFNWDSFWHQEIAEIGYYFIPGKPSNIAFFPLYPMVVQLSSFVVGTLRSNGFIISNLALFLAVVYLVKLVRLEFGDESVAGRSAMYLLVFPGSLFFSYFYSEGLFLFLSLAAFYSARKRRWLAASIFGCLTCLTKITGVLILVPLLIEYFEPRLQAGKFKLSPAKLNAAWLLLVPLGLLGFMAYCGFKFADPLAFFHAQAAWGANALNPAGVLAKILLLPPFYRMLYVGLMIFALLMILVMIRKGFRASSIAYAALLLAVYLASNALESTPRQLSVVFPLFIGMAFLGKNRLVHQLIIFVSVALLTLFTVLSANGYWFV